MKKISTNIIKEKVKELCIKANYVLPKDVESCIKQAEKTEKSKLSKFALSVLSENIDIAKKKKNPLCQDTGMVIVFLEIGQDVHIVDGYINDAVNSGIKEAYKQEYFRKSVVSDPILRKNTNTNTPAVIYTDIVKGDKIKISIMPKGFGSENVGKVYMLNPTSDENKIIDCVVNTVKDAGASCCPPIIIGVGIGGTMDKAAVISKKALFRKVGKHSRLKHIKELETKILKKVNETNIGVQGFGGKLTAFAVNIETFPTHIAGLPVAVSIVCNSARHVAGEVIGV